MPLVWSLLSPFWRLRIAIGGLQIGQLTLDFLIDFCDESLVVPIARQRLPERENVLDPIIAFQRLGHGVLTALHTGMTQLREFDGISLTSENRIEDTKSAETSDVAQNPMHLQIHLIQGLLHMHHVLCCHLDETIAMSPE